MPEKYVREMFADWVGASRAYEGKWPKFNKWRWWDNNFAKIEVHYRTRELLGKLYYKYFNAEEQNANIDNYTYCKEFIKDYHEFAKGVIDRLDKSE